MSFFISKLSQTHSHIKAQQVWMSTYKHYSLFRLRWLHEAWNIRVHVNATCNSLFLLSVSSSPPLAVTKAWTTCPAWRGRTWCWCTTSSWRCWTPTRPAAAAKRRPRRAPTRTPTSISTPKPRRPPTTPPCLRMDPMRPRSWTDTCRLCPSSPQRHFRV